MRVLAVAESDAYLKWAAWLLERMPAGWHGELCLVDSVISPSSRQIEAALAGTTYRPSAVPMLGAVAVRRRILRRRPDVVVLAATGRTVAALCASLWGHRRPVVVAGIPGVGLPVRDPAVRSRRAVDVFIAHSEREREEFAAGFAEVGAPTVVAISRLPFLTRCPRPPTDDPMQSTQWAGPARPVFAAQPSVPFDRADRTLLLQRLAALGPPAPLVKLRGGDGELATHDEPHPYPELWAELVADGVAGAEQLEFATGPLADVLPTASCLITISSTAALEAIDHGRPVLIVDDFGVDETLLNAVFVGSGLIGPLTRESVGRASAPDPDWAARNYFHPAAAEDWIEKISSMVGAAVGDNGDHRGRFFVGDLRSIRQGVARLGVGRWRRRRRS